jgi:hypothetical protein
MNYQQRLYPTLKENRIFQELKERYGIKDEKALKPEEDTQDKEQQGQKKAKAIA